MDADKLKEIVKLHGMWLRSEVDGSRANLYGANLSRANLSRANLYGANLSRANLSRANLYGANLYGANLSRANLYGANLSRADLYGANLSRADLYGANLYGAKNLSELQKARFRITPIDCDIIGWKKCKNGIIVKLLVPKNAQRSNAPSGRKCRAQFVKVLEVFSKEKAISMHDGKTEYKKGKIVKCDKWEEDFTIECGGGIHFYITREEAEAHS